MIEKLRKCAQENEQRILELRHQIHQYPELAFEEVRTAKVICEELDRLGIEIHANYADTTAVVGVIQGVTDGPTRALRADIDALPVQEETGLPFASKIPGKMHACGHDAHTAILLGTAHLLTRFRSQLAGRIVLVFQPGEEGHAGARVLVEYGLLEEFGIEAMFGHHVWANLPPGHFATRPGVMTSNSDNFSAEIKGRGAHAARPNMGIDPVVVASHFVLACQDIISREVSPNSPAVITFGKLRAGEAYNVIPERAIFEGTVRTQSAEVQNFVQERMQQVLQGITSAFRTTGTLTYRRLYPSVINHQGLTRDVMTLAEDFWGTSQVATIPHASMVGEDFAFYTKKVASCFGFLGIGSPYDHHNPRFVVDESTLAPAAAWTSYIALKSAEFMP
ncbi:hypothetical protein CSA56_09900 [candidate division KSB3 bacterium]|uniref:Peptidase M20 dimerisation domain-containing protein n=1 Tax=candidate division KSB3 bacterium TaxID=2044937 RepID=A0A2G6KDP4_9BACT|nr:MAG: hypothetical protein CSA56_09900 [candidate division KSB3 bacterium]